MPVMTKTFATVAALLWLLVTLVTAPVWAQGLPSAKPEQVGLSSERLERVVATLRADADKGRIPGAVLLVARHGKVALFEAVGMLDPASKNPMTRDAIFRIYSMSKPITSVAIMMLVEEGKIAPGDPVAKYLPQFTEVKVGIEKPGADGKPTLELVAPRRPMTVQDLLRHTSGLTYGIFGSNAVKRTYLDVKLFDDNQTNGEFVDRLAKLPLASQPGTMWDYSHSTDVLGRIVEVVSGKTLYEFERERILGPLGMKDTAFYVADRAKHARVAEPFPDDRTIGIDAVFGDPRVPIKWESGGGGMVGTTMDYARFCQMLLGGGALDGKRLLSPKTVSYMAADHLDGSIAPGPLYLPGAGFGFGLGLAVRRDAGVASMQGSVGEMNWGGAGGTYFWIDPKEDMLVVFAMQSPKERVYYRPLLKNMVYGAVVKPNGK
jgi:CubicO group peptidase (beta-lactamase class C family)